MEKREMHAVGIIFVLFSLSLIFLCIVADHDYGISVMATIFGLAGIIFLYRSEAINNETAILSSGMFILGGIIVPLISLIKDHSSFLMALSFGTAIALMVLKPPDRKTVRAPVHHN